jgi:hypothetical protein
MRTGHLERPSVTELPRSRNYKARGDMREFGRVADAVADRHFCGDGDAPHSRHRAKIDGFVTSCANVFD